MSIQQSMEQFASALTEYIGDNDEAIDSYGRAPEPMEYRNGFEYTAPAYLNFYSSTGTGAPWQDRIIERLEQAQADKWAQQFPDRADLFTVAALDESPLQSEAHEWLDAALEGEAIYISFEIFSDDDDVTIRASFTDEINAPLATQFDESMTSAEFLAMDDDASTALIERIADAIYTAKESPT